MFLDEVPMNYMAVVIAAILYFIMGAIWYSPHVFGHRSMKHDGVREFKQLHSFLSYIGEFCIDLVIAFVLVFFIQFSQAEEYADGVMIALWIWIGFVATTHLSAVLWSRKTLKSFFIHTIFNLLGLIGMSLAIIYFLQF